MGFWKLLQNFDFSEITSVFEEILKAIGWGMGPRADLNVRILEDHIGIPLKKMTTAAKNSGFVAIKSIKWRRSQSIP